MPSRIESLRKALPAILAQVDRLYLFLDKYSEEPDVARHPKIVPLSSRDYGPLGASGKFLGLTRLESPAVYVTFDDDIYYPPSYAAALVRGLARHGGRAVVGYHGSRFTAPFRSYMSDRVVYRFGRELLWDRRVDMLGTGTSALLSAQFDFDCRQWPHNDMDDLMIALEAERRGIPRIALRRRPFFLTPVASDQPDSIYARVQADERRHAAPLAELMRLLGRKAN